MESLIISLIWEPKNFYQKKTKYLHELFEKWDPEHREIDEDGLEDNVENKGMQNL